jgi:hypothetical protein
MPQLREKLKSVGARWGQEERLWRVRYGLIRGDRELEERVVRMSQGELDPLYQELFRVKIW